MSESAPARLTLSTRHLSADGARVTTDDDVTSREIGAAEALAVLQAFARLPAVELVEIEAKVYLAGPRGKVAVQNVRGKLFVANVPETVNASAERTPEETIALLTSADPAAVSAAAAVEAAKEEAAIAEAAGAPAGLRGLLNSVWVLVVVASVAAVMAYFNFAPERPEGVAMIGDAGRIAQLHTQVNGRYGEPGTTSLVLEQGKLTGYESTQDGAPPEAFFERSYRFGEVGQQVVLVLDNGALLTVQPDRSLKFLDSVYPRETPAR